MIITRPYAPLVRIVVHRVLVVPLDIQSKRKEFITIKQRFIEKVSPINRQPRTSQLNKIVNLMI